MEETPERVAISLVIPARDEAESVPVLATVSLSSSVTTAIARPRTVQRSL